MNIRITIGQRRGGANVEANKVLPQGTIEEVAMPINPTRLTDVEVSAYLAQMSQTITIKYKSMTDKVN